MSILSYRELKVWQKAMDLAEASYQTTKAFPAEEKFGLISQIRRAAVQVPANIAEGQGRTHTREFLNHLSMAKGSLLELETLLQISQRVGILDFERLDYLLKMSDEIGRMLTSLRHRLEEKLNET